MSHEVNNSTTASNSLLESSLTYAAELPAGSARDLDHALRIAIERSSQLNRFMRRFADVFRLPAPATQPNDLHVLLDRVVALTRARANGTSVTWSPTGGAGAPFVDLDTDQFEQACLNILRNAVEAAGPDGDVLVSVVVGPEVVTLTIDDSGPGLDAEASAHVFTPFFSTKPNGQGVGLTLVQEILAGHGFAFGLERLPGGPTRFTIQMPAIRT
jgi:signal transduction histidine kinase